MFCVVTNTLHGLALFDIHKLQRLRAYLGPLLLAKHAGKTPAWMLDAGLIEISLPSFNNTVTSIPDLHIFV